MLLLRLCFTFLVHNYVFIFHNYKEIKVGNDQEMALSQRNFHSKNRAGKNKLTIRYLYLENIS